MPRHALVCFFKTFGMLLLELPVQALGLVVNAIAIPFRYAENTPENDGLSRPYSQFPQHGNWLRHRLPCWALWWDNPYDGLTGDKRGWWANECRAAGRTEYDFLSMYLWSVIRNPANYFSRKVAGCDVSDCTITKLAGNAKVVDGSGASGRSWHFIVATDSKGRRFYRLYGVWPYSATRAVYVNFGWKIKLEHNGAPPSEREQDRFKGNTIRLSPWQLLD